MTKADESASRGATERMPVRCARCSAPLLPQANFCAECGQPVGGGSARQTMGLGLGVTTTGGHGPTGARSVDDRMASSRRVWLGRIVDGRYRVLECIGQGGMGVIYRVEHIRLGKHAAMKVLHSDLVDRRDVVARFEREAYAVSRLTHPNTIGVFDFGSERGQLYLVMEWVRGIDLSQLIERDGPMPWERAVPLMVQVCASLSEAHSMSIIHRDLKPENILVTRDASNRDFVKVLDFGLAALLERDPTGVAAGAALPTENNEIVGTPYFMAPEQIRGTQVSARTDIYSLGAMMYQVVTGRHVFSGENALEVLSAHLNLAPISPHEYANMPRALGELILHCLAKAPAERPASAEEIGARLTRVFESNQPSRQPAAPRSMAAQLPATALANSSWQLQRSDLDAFETALKRRRLGLRMLALALTILGGLAVWLAVARSARPPAPARTEREPNNTLAQAVPMAVGVEVSGHLGKRVSSTQGDVDMFVASLGEPARAYDVMVTAPPNVDISLRLYAGDGRLLAESDLGRVGDAEWLGPRQLHGDVVLEIAAATPAGERPTENVSDPYTVVLAPIQAGPEFAVEPNNGIADAVALTAAGMQGAFDGDDDVAWLRFGGQGGSYRVRVQSEAAVSLRLDNKDVTLTAGGAMVSLQAGALLELQPSKSLSRKQLAGASWATPEARKAGVSWRLELAAP